MRMYAEMVTKLRLLRLQADMTLREFAKELGLSETLLVRVERGHSYVPPAWRAKLAGALGRRPEELWDPVTGWPKLVRRGGKIHG